MARNTQFKSHFFRSFIIVGVAVGLVGCDSKVMERTRTYSCCNPKIVLDQGCEHTWKINKTSFAHFSKHSNECIRPCKRIEDGMMTLDECAAVNVTTVITDEMGVISEERIYFFPERCPNSVPAGGNQVAGSIILMLLVSMNVFIEL